MNLSHPCRLLFSALLHYYFLLSTTLLIKSDVSGPSQIFIDTPGIAQAGKVNKQRKDLGAAVDYWIFFKFHSHQALAGTHVYCQTKILSSIYSFNLPITQ